MANKRTTTKGSKRHIRKKHIDEASIINNIANRAGFNSKKKQLSFKKRRGTGKKQIKNNLNDVKTKSENSKKQKARKQIKRIFGLRANIFLFLSLAFGLVIALFFVQHFVHHNTVSTDYDFNGFHFYKTIGNVWKTNFQYHDKPYQLYLKNDPKSLLMKNYTIPKYLFLFLRLKKVNLVVDPDISGEYTIAMYDLGKVLASVFLKKVVYGISRPINISANNTAGDAGKKLNVLNCSEFGFYFTHNNNTNTVYWKDHCLVLNVTNPKIAVELADYYVYNYLGILKN